jgi:hypothetical protein
MMNLMRYQGQDEKKQILKKTPSKSRAVAKKSNEKDKTLKHINLLPTSPHR